MSAAMQGSEFLKNVRKNFDPCFRYILMARQTPFQDDRAFSDVLRWIDTDSPAVMERSFHRDEASDTVALVIKLRPQNSTSIVQALVSARLPEDIAFYIYENEERFCGPTSEGTDKENGE